MTYSKKIMSNTAYHAAGRVWQIAVVLFLTPLILSYLGDEQFALWALFWTFSTYFMFMDFGLGISLVRETAQCSSKGEHLVISQALNSLLLFYMLLGAIALLFAWFASPEIIKRLNVSNEMAGIVLEMLHWGVFIFVLIGLVNTLAALLRGLQRYDLITKAMFFVSVPNLLGTYLILELGFGIVGLLWVVTAIYLLQLLLLLFYSKRVMPKLVFGVKLISWHVIKEMLPFGARLQVSKFAELASYQTDKILLALLMPVQFVTMYDLGAKIASLMRDLPYSLTSAVFPAASEMHGQDDFKRLWQMYDIGSKYLLVTTLPMLFGLWLTAHLIIGMWLGFVSEYVYQSVLILSSAYWMVVSLAMSFSVGTGMGWSKPVMQSSILQAVVNVLLSYWLIQALGFIGALCGTAIAITVANTILYYRFCRHFERSIKVEVSRLWLVIKGNIPAVIACGLFVFMGDQWLEWGDRFMSILLFVGAVIVYVVTYLLSLRIFQVFDREDLRLLEGKVPMIRWLVISPMQKEETH